MTIQRPLTLRHDALPERYHYRDDGCEVAPACLQCPLPQCKYDEPRPILRVRRDQRDQEIIRQWQAEQLSVPVLARRFNVSTRTITRALSRQNQAADQGDMVGVAPRASIGQSEQRPTGT